MNQRHQAQRGSVGGARAALTATPLSVPVRPGGGEAGRGQPSQAAGPVCRASPGGALLLAPRGLLTIRGIDFRQRRLRLADEPPRILRFNDHVLFILIYFSSANYLVDQTV